MIHIDNKIKNIPQSLIDTVRSVVTGKQVDELSRKTLGSYAKKALDDVSTHADSGDRIAKLAGDSARSGDKESATHFGKMAADRYRKAANRRAGAGLAIDKMAKEEVEQIDELSKDTLYSYMKKSKADPAFEKRKGKVSAVRKAIMAKRTKGQERAKAAISDIHAKKSAEMEKLHHENVAHVRAHIHDILDKNGFTKQTTHAKRDVYTKPNHVTGHVITATVHHAGSQPSTGYEPQVLSLSNSSGWQSSEDRHRVERHPLKPGSMPWERDYDRAPTKKEAIQAVHTHIKNYETAMAARGDHMYESVQDEKPSSMVDMVAKSISEQTSKLQLKKTVEETSDHQNAYTSQISVDEARGRPRKNPLPTGQQEEPEPRQHIIQQLQRAKLSMRGGEHVTFKDGTKHHVSGTQAAKLLDKYAGMKPYEKEAFQKKIGSSHNACKEEM